MPRSANEKEHLQLAAEQVLGYLNLSSGAYAPILYSGINTLFCSPPNKDVSGGVPPWRGLIGRLRQELDRLCDAEQTAFRDSHQARSILSLVEDQVLPGYLEFHSELLFHRDESAIFNPFFIARAMQAVLQAGPPWEEARRIVDASVRQLNDYVGYRPVATLESRRSEPYPHEFVGAVPLYLRDIGVASGPYAGLIEKTLELLRATAPEILGAAHFNPEWLDELAFDPRAFDFDHPVNRRPNYQFGEWDPARIDAQGRYRRFVVQQLTLDILLERVTDDVRSEREYLLFEASAVLAGTILMGAGVSGWGPGAHDSSTTLGQLVRRIASYRDAFYDDLFSRLDEPLLSRLREERRLLQQPFGGARQHLNTELGRWRAAQREHAHLARAYARMGYYEAGRKEVERVPAPSARILCQLDCWLTAAHAAVDLGEIDKAATYLPLIRNLLERGIQCGAIIDPWNIIGFDARFPLFLSPDDSVHDERADELISIVHHLLNLHARIWSEAAARHDQPLCVAVREQYEGTVSWWRRFAAHEVESVDAVDPAEAFRAAEHVAGALDKWHQGGAATGDVAFWAPHAAMFGSPQAYAAVIEALLEREDFVASQGLLVHWLSQADRVPLQQEEHSFFVRIEQWLLQFREAALRDDRSVWAEIRRFFDYIEANAEEYWRPPRWELNTVRREQREDHASGGGEDDDADAWDEQASLFDAAYENVVYRDSTADGVDGSIDDGATDEEENRSLIVEAERIEMRLAFLNTVARMWKLVAVTPQLLTGGDEASIAETVTHWIEELTAQLAPLKDLIDDIHALPIGSVRTDYIALLEYDRRRMIKESLLEVAINAAVELGEALHFLCAGGLAFTEIPPADVFAEVPLEADERDTIHLFAAMLSGDTRKVRRRWETLSVSLESRPLLYIPVGRGGNPHEIVQARMRRRAIQNLLSWMPRLGMLAETCHLIEIAREMEHNHPVGPGAVTEFDELFRIGFRGVVGALVESAESWTPDRTITDDAFVRMLEQFTEVLLASWLSHSQTLRLSVLEKLPASRWKGLVDFIETYGGELFTQEFLGIGNLRALLHQGIEQWLGYLQDDPEGERYRLVRDLDRKIPFEKAVSDLTLTLEAIVENYGEYRDYNGMTTQSDRGELLYTFLDFIRLRSDYDRIQWKLTPVVLTHEILVRHGHEEVAQLWRQATEQRTRRQARHFLRKLAQLQRQYAMRMPSVMERLEERFVRPMLVDQTRAMVRPAIEERRAGEPGEAFDVLAANAEELMSHRCGSGWDMPNWLLALEEEVDQVTREHQWPQIETAFRDAIGQRELTRNQLRRQLNRAIRLSEGG